jgi:hypothetical protein
MTMGYAVVGCDQAPRPPVPPPPPNPTGPTTAPSGLANLALDKATPVYPGYVAGRVFTTDGMLLQRPDARVRVEMKGILASSENVTVTIDAQPDGTYSKKLEPGLYYQPYARIEFSFAGSNYRLPLVPIAGGAIDASIGNLDSAMRWLYRVTGRLIDFPIEQRGDKIPRPPPLATAPVQEASVGVSQDFVWRLSGLRPGASRDEEKPESWLGGSMSADYISFLPDTGHSVVQPPSGTRVFFVVTPNGPLADGSPGKTVIAERHYEAAGNSVYHPLIHDIPLCRFTVSGFELLPNGKTRPLLFMRRDRKWYDFIQHIFPSDLEKAMLEPQRFPFTRREE